MSQVCEEEAHYCTSATAARSVPQCILCPVSAGALKRAEPNLLSEIKHQSTDHPELGPWVHVICVMWYVT